MSAAAPLAALLERWHLLGMGVLLAAAASSQAAPTAHGITHPQGYQSIWSVRVGPVNLFELGVAAALGLWALRAVSVRGRGSALDSPLALTAIGVAALQVVVLALNRDDLEFFLFDLEHLLVPLAAYFLVTRAVTSLRQVRGFTIALATVIVLHATQLVLSHGIFGSTNFGVVSGREAVLITEDSLLLMLPVLLAWGALVDRSLGRAGAIGTLVLVGSAVAVNLLSLRRGAVLFIALGLGVRSLSAGRRSILTGAAVLAVAAGLVVLAGPGRGVVHDLRYTASSALLQSNDDSSSQRTSELENLSRNLSGPDWAIGRGIGVIWRAEVPAPVDLASFGDKETAFIRIGWHVYGLDWAYKLGLLGLGGVLAFLVLVLRRAAAAYRSAGSAGYRSLLFSLTVCLPVFGLFAFTNLRLACFAGVVLGLVSRLLDQSAEDTSPEPT